MSIDTQQDSLFPSDSHAPATTHTVYLALGANIGDRLANLATALQLLHKEVKIEMLSSLYETEPVGYADQPRFLNIVCRGKTLLDAENLLKHAKEIETAIGRKTSFRNGPRSIDIDIIFYDNLLIEQDQLTIPHPRMRERAFVLVPLAEIAPEIVDPVSKKNILELLAEISQKGVSKVAKPDRISLGVC